MPGRLVAGFVAGAHPSVLVAAARDFLGRLEAGSGASEARDGTNALLQAWRVPARLAFATGSPEDYRLPPAPGSFWGDRAPADAEMSLFFLLRPWCSPTPGAPEQAEEEKQGNPGVRGIRFDGPVFRGEWDLKVSETKTLHATVLGVMGELRPGAHFHFVWQGAVKGGFDGLTFYANAEIVSVRAEGATTTVDFEGTALALPYVDEDGRQCSLHDTYLEPMVQGAGVSQMVLRF
jgi:hypothetical protein